MVKFLLAVNCLIALIAISNIKANPVSDTKPTCNIVQDVFPADQSLKPKLLPNSPDDTTLVNVTSYLVLLDKPKSGYLPLELQSVGQTNDGTLNVGLNFDCATYTIHVVPPKTGAVQQYAIASIDVNLKAASEKEPKWTCSSEKIGSTFPVGRRFSCLGRLVFTCYAKVEDGAKQVYSKPVAEIVFANGLEIELGGKSSEIKNNKFSQDAFPGSCPK